ncbi:hypothetical protein EUGRSUZ_B00726 [Eucalyptus grandis]|uniref:Uncharacterized protein n=2 Tax=Eucalyptus grandis TaxID=71139 RepID=A0ACC3LN45_EUCGR|nr:hypothetical protein EUGRSUZ_B00726 [Eucalyptus grandis]
MEVDWSSFHVLAKTSHLVHEGLLSLYPTAQTRPTELPEIFWNKILEMHGQGVMLVLEKRLCATDLKQRNGWLSIPRGQIRANFLTSGEIQALDNREDITISVIEPCLQVRHGLHLQKWNNVRNHFSYVLTKEWTAVTHPIARNRLRKGGLVQLWSFRANGDLCFCLVNVEAPPAAVENMGNQE